MSDLIISAYGSHNAAISMYYKGEYTVVEVERWLNSKNIGLTTYMPCYMPQIVFDEITDWLLAKAGKTEVDVYMTDYVQNITPKFKYNKHISYDHHTAHAAAAFYQSPYESSLVISFDGGGDGSYFNVYYANRLKGITLIDKLNYDLGFPYMFLADFLEDIKKESLSIGNLVYAGKLMGLCSYGKVREEWLPHFIEYYKKFIYTGDSYMGGLEASYDAASSLFKKIGMDDFNMQTTRISGQMAWDIAATTQKAFEEFFLILAKPHLDKYSELPLCLSGGCALNVLLNARLLEMKKGNVFVPPNTNDCGISVGGLLWHLKPRQQVDLTYSGLPVLDDVQFSTHVQDGKYEVFADVTVKELAELISSGNIIGMIQGNSEHGSRALGNRSIICNPIEGMKDTLNHKVKNREWYRPFAPICKLEDVERYFHFPYNVESRHMTFVAKVRDEWKDILPAITHEDGTARLQTVTEDQNPLIYQIINEVEKLTGHGVILNTSFNVNGKPILTRLSDAFHILDTSKLDAVFYKNCLIFRRGEARSFKRSHLFSPKKTTSGVAFHAYGFPQNETQLNILADNIKRCDHSERVFIGSKSTLDKLSELGVSLDNWFIHEIGENRKYLSNTTQSKTIEDFSNRNFLLWMKEILKENHFNCSHHTFVNFCNELTKEKLQSLISLAQNDSMIFMSSIGMDKATLFGEDYLITKFGKTLKLTATADIVCGSYDNIEWLSNSYEANLLWNSSMGLRSDFAHDYLPLTLLEKPEVIKLL